jgi:Flp pilus assembly protein TadD
VLNDLATVADEEEPLDESEAVRAVVGKVARRMLYHLEHRPEREQDLRDIVALALLLRADRDLLAQLWCGQSVHQRLRDLGARYALVSGGDLHPTVRDYLRRHWRGDERPAVFEETLAALEQALAELPRLSDEDGRSAGLARTVLECNLKSWRLADAAVPVLARSLAVALAYAEGVEDFQSLLSELPLAGARLAEARKLWKKPQPPGVIRWLRGVCDSSRGWSAHEQACLALVEGVAVSAGGVKPPVALGALALLKKALDHFSAERMPQKERAGEAFYCVARILNPCWSKEERWLRETEEAYMGAIELQTREASCFNHLGHFYRNYLQRHAEAEQACARALELNPRDALTQNNLGLVYYDLKRYDEAEQAYRRAIELDPKYATPHNNLGYLLYDQKRYSEAEQAYRRAIELDPKDATPHNNLGTLCRHQKRYGEAEQAYWRAIELGPKNATPHNNLGNLCRDQKRYSEAEQAYRRATELDAKLATAHSNLGILCRDQKRYGEAEQAYRRAIELDPKDATPHNSLGYLYLELNRPDEAKRCYQHALHLAPNNGSAYRGLAWLCLLNNRGDMGQARSYAQRAAQADPEHAATPLAILAVTTWTSGWAEARASIADWLARCDSWVATSSRFRIVALFREIRRQSGLADCAAMLRAVEDRPWWKPWSEAVGALAAGKGAEACTTPEAAELYRELAQP